MMARCGVLREPPDSHRARGRKAGAHVAHAGADGNLVDARRGFWRRLQRERAADALCLKARGAVRAGGRGGRGGRGGKAGRGKRKADTETEAEDVDETE